MSGVDRDVQCGNSFAKLYELGCFDEEFMVYGCGYLEKESIHYLISSNGNKIVMFKNEALFRDILATPVVSKVVRCPVASGRREQIKQEIKLELAKEIKSTYPKEYFDTLLDMSKVKASDTACAFLKSEQERINGYFVPEQIQLFQGLCNMAYANKKITKASYEEFAQWLKYAHQQMENDVQLKDKFKRTFFGFGYKKGNIIQYYADAQMINVYEKRDQFLAEGVLVSPVINKVYWFNALNQLSKVRQNFRILLSEHITDEVLKKVEIVSAV